MPGYTLADGVTLKNKLGAQSHAELESFEAIFVPARLEEIAEGLGPRGCFDLDHLKAIHGHLFQDVYEWAGHSRDERVRLSDGTIAYEPHLRKIDGKPFKDADRIAPDLNATFERLAEQDHLRGLDRETFAVRGAEVFAEINTAHAFRDGNGRTQRAFIIELAKEAGHELRFDVVSRERIVQASIAAHDGDVTAFQRMFREISDAERVAALAEAQSFLDKHRGAIDWRDRYMSTTEEGQTYELTFVGRAGPNFLARTSSAILVGRSSDLPEPQPASGDTFRMTAAIRRAAASEKPTGRKP